VNSEPGDGATFIIELPIITKVIISQEKTDTPVNYLTKTRKAKGLVVDDEKIILTYLRRLLSGWGYETDLVNNAKEAIEMIKSNSYDFILLDIKMPEMNGTRLYHYIEKLKPDMVKKIIFATGDILENSTSAFLQEIKALTLTKPIDIEKLKISIDKILDANS
jgi:CheY-like chemotaxis protein